MNEKPYFNVEAFHKAQARGRRKLHTQIMWLSFFLIIYMLCGFVAIQALLDELAIVRYCIQAGIELLFLLLCNALLWKESKYARILFTLCTLLSLYAIYSICQLFTFPMPLFINQTIRVIYAIFYTGKALILLVCTFRLYQKPICRVWEHYETEGKQAEEEDRILIQQLMVENDEVLQKKQSARKIIIRAQRNLRSYTLGLSVFLYGSMLLFYFGIFIVRYYFPWDVNGIEYVQRYVLLSSLYTALVYSFVAVLMFLYRGASRYALYAALLMVILRLVVTFPNTLTIFQTQHYALPAILTLLLSEGIRYVVLIRFTILFQRNPFLKAYWKIKQRKQ